MKDIILYSELICPECGQQQTCQMPTDACQWFYECIHCHFVMKPEQGDCCVFCSYGSVPCPPVQMNSKRGGGGYHCE